MCADVLAESVVFWGRVCPSHLHRPATSLRSAPFRACSWGSASSASANSSHGVSHHRTAYGNCSLGAMAYCRTHTSSGASYRERNRSRKHPERTERQVCFRFRSQQRSVRCAVSEGSRIRTERLGSTVFGLCTLHGTVFSSTAARWHARKEHEQQQAANEASTSHQPSVNRSSTKRQRNVNRSSTKRQRNIKSGIFSTRMEITRSWWPSTERAECSG